MTHPPVRYSAAVEKLIDDEESVHRELIETMRSISETTVSCDEKTGSL